MFIVALLRLLDVKNDGIALFAKTSLLSFDEKLLLCIFGLLINYVTMILKVAVKWHIFIAIARLGDSIWIIAANYAPYLIDLCCLGGMVILMLVSISFSDLLIPPIIVWFILSIDEFIYNSLLNLCPNEIIESLLCSNKVNQVCHDGFNYAKKTMIGSTIGWLLIVIMFIIFFFALDK